MRLTIKILVIAIATLATSCGPTYQTTYSYSPPEDALASICINQCVSIQQQCVSEQEQLYQNCENRAALNYNKPSVLHF